MRCDTCGNDSAVVQRVVIAKDYDRSMARPLYNCPACYETKEAKRSGLWAQGSGQLPGTPNPEPRTDQRRAFA